MDIINSIITNLNKEEVRFFKLYLSRVETEDDRKDVLFFDYVRKSAGNYDDDKIFKRLYSSSDKNAFYRLKNRLMRELNKSITLQHFDSEELVYVFRLLALVKFYINKNQVTTAHFFLKKAEVKAQHIESYELLDLIYGEFIKLSREMVSINPVAYIEKRKSNTEKLTQVRQIDDILAAVTYRLKVTQNYGGGDNPVLKTLEKTISELQHDKKLLKSPVVRFRIYNAISQVLLQKHQYKVLENYLLKTFADFEKESLFNRNNHDTKLQMLTYIVNTLYKNNKLKESLEYAQLLNKSMKEFGGLLFDKYLFYYYNSLVINYSQLDKNRALEIIDELSANEKIKNNSFYQQFIWINRFLLLFDLKDYHKAARSLTKLYLLKDYKNYDETIRYKIAVADLITRFELNDLETLTYKMKQTSKDFKHLSYNKDFVDEKEIISALKLMSASNERVNEKIVLKKLSEFKNRNKKVKHADESGIIHYNNWIEEKINHLK
jgi:hypothetical protein